MPTTANSTPRTSLMIWVILSLYPLVGMGVDLIAPSLPAISKSLQASSTFSKNLITLYLLGYALGSFLMGFLSDTFGRRRLVIAGFLIFSLASLLPIFFPTEAILLLARGLQGFTIAAFSVIGRAILSDILIPEKLMRVIVSVAILWGLGPIIGPVIGGYLQYYFNWQAGFYFFAGYGLMGLIATIIFIPETHFNRQALQIKQIGKNFLEITTHRNFIGLVILMGLVYSLLIVFNAVGPFLIQIELGRSSIFFGHLALLMGLIYLMGSLACRHLVKRFLPANIIFIAVHGFLILSISALLLSYFYSENIWIIAFSSIFMYLACGVIYPACMARGMSFFRHLAGSSTAVMILINVMITAMISLLISGVHVNSAISLSWIYVCLMMLGLVVYWILIRHDVVVEKSE